MSCKPYPSDLTDAQWQLIEPLLPAARLGGWPRKTNLPPRLACSNFSRTVSFKLIASSLRVSQSNGTASSTALLL
jgi:transposase